MCMIINLYPPTFKPSTQLLQPKKITIKLHASERELAPSSKKRTGPQPNQKKPYLPTSPHPSCATRARASQDITTAEEQTNTSTKTTASRNDRHTLPSSRPQRQGPYSHTIDTGARNSAGHPRVAGANTTVFILLLLSQGVRHASNGRKPRRAPSAARGSSPRRGFLPHRVAPSAPG